MRWRLGLRQALFFTHTHLAIIVWSIVGIVVLGFAVLFFWPKQHAFSFAGNNCFFNPVWLPNTVSAKSGQSLTVATQPAITVAGYPLYSHTTCIEPAAAVSAQSSETLQLAPFGNSFAGKKISVNISSLPVPSAKVKPGSLVASREPLAFSLDRTDNLFDYQLTANKRSTMCAKLGRELRCNLERLQLAQSKEYEFNLERMYAGQSVESVLSQSFTTVEPIKIKKSSIRDKATVFNKPESITLRLSKPAESISGVSLTRTDGQEAKKVEIVPSIDGNKLTIQLVELLARQADFKLIIKEVLATDNGFLSHPYELTFKTSGGPKVAATSIASYGVAQKPSIYLTFDSAPNAKQAGSFIQLENSSGVIGSYVSVTGKQVVLTPKSALPWCKSFTLRVKNGLKNKYGVNGGSNWTFNSRTICHTLSSIGSSVKGRSILAYKFGSGPSKVVFVGGTHGDEPSSKYTLDSFINSLEANFNNIPKNRTVIVVPSINPDGIASGSRTNANNVDLNRNFPANNWKSDVVMPNGKLNKRGGGDEPLSEPESKALANYVLAQNPDLVLTYHAIGSLAIANESGNSLNLARKYGSLTGFTSLGNSQIGNTFSHDTNGAFEDWLHDKHGIPAILIELSFYGANEFYYHNPAMWAMVKP